MTGKERVIKAINCEKVDRVPWVPFVGCHAASLLGVTATDYFKSAKMIAEGAQKAIEEYSPDGIPVTFDLQIEAEVLGCGVKYADDNPPAVVNHPLANGSKLEDLKIPGPGEGRIKIAMDAAKAIRKANPDIALYATITGPFTLALHLQGTDIFMNMFEDPDHVLRLIDYCTSVAKAMTDYYVDAGCDVIAVVDPMTSQIGPDQFRQFISPAATELFEHIRTTGAKGSFFVCGHAQQNIEAMCECKPDNVSIDENIPLDYVRDECVKRNISFGGNLQLTTVLLLGSEIDAQKDAIRCIDLGKDTGFILAPGCDLPFATPVENLKAVTTVVQDEYQRDVIRTMENTAGMEDVLDMSLYGQTDKVIVDIITLDSEACAPCQYMVDAVRKVAPQFDGIVEWREHKIKNKEAIQFMAALMVKNIPTICIDGMITFVSRIPPKDELIRAIQNRINEKFRLKIKNRKASVYLLSLTDEANCEKCTKVKENIEQAKQELGADVDFEIVSDKDKIHEFGIADNQLPAVVVAKYQLKSTHSVPEVIVLKEWLKDAVSS
jgi:MtaA/CmuA family methyltransferase